MTGPDLELLGRVRMLANHGRVEHYVHAVVGTNSRLDGLQAAILNLRRVHLPTENDRRRAIAAAYRDRLGGVGDLRFVHERAEAEAVYHQVTVRTTRRDELRQYLTDHDVGSAIFYPIPLHRLEATQSWVAPATSLPVAEAAAATALSLPMYPQLTEAGVDRVGELIECFYAG